MDNPTHQKESVIRTLGKIFLVSIVWIFLYYFVLSYFKNAHPSSIYKITSIYLMGQAGIIYYFIKQRKITIALKLKKNEQIIVDRTANLFRGKEAVGGRLKITNQRLIFEPHIVNIQKQTLEIPLNQIREVKPRNTLGIVPNGILVKLVSGEEYKLVVWKRKELIELINTNK